MARDFARSFYHSPAWLRNRKLYMNAYVDTEGHIVSLDKDGFFYYTDEYGYHTGVDSSRVVPPRMCERCFSMGRLFPAKVVHHIEWLNPSNIDDSKVTLGYDNFMRVCQDCHAAIHSGIEESRVSFDENGNIVWKDES